MPSTRYSVVIYLKSAQEHASLKLLAAKCGKSFSGWIRDIMMKELIIEEYKHAPAPTPTPPLQVSKELIQENGGEVDISDIKNLLGP